MTLESLKAIIAEAGGDKYVIGFLFGSAYKFIYNKINFDSSVHIKDSMDCVMIEVKDCYGTPCKIYAPIDDIKQVVVRNTLDQRVDLTSIIMS